MTDTERQQQILIATAGLQRFVLDIHEAWTVSMNDTVEWIHQARVLQDHMAADVGGPYAQAMARLIDHAEQRRYAFSLLQAVIVQAQAQLDDLLRQLAHGVTPGEVVLEHNPWTGESW